MTVIIPKNLVAVSPEQTLSNQLYPLKNHQTSPYLMLKNHVMFSPFFKWQSMWCSYDVLGQSLTVRGQVLVLVGASHKTSMAVVCLASEMDIHKVQLKMSFKWSCYLMLSATWSRIRWFTNESHPAYSWIFWMNWYGFLKWGYPLVN